MLQTPRPTAVPAFQSDKEIADEIDKAAEKDRHKKICAFDIICGDYFVVTGRLVRNAFQEDDECYRLCDERDNLIWRLVRTPALIERHRAYKFQVLREIMGTDWTDGRHRALLESIRNDANAETDI